MGEIVQIADARSRKDRSQAVETAAAGERARRAREFEAVECGSGWYHGEAIGAAREPSLRPR